MPLPESALRDQIFSYLTRIGLLVWKDYQPNAKPGKGYSRSKTSVADILGVMPDGQFLAVEVKKPDGKVSMGQWQWLERVRRSNGFVIVATSVADVQTQIAIWKKTMEKSNANGTRN